MKILVGSKNPVKISGAKLAFSNYFENIDIEGVSVSSDVSSQPFDDEILQGARNRVKNLIEYAKNNSIDADYFCSIESGITNKFGFYMNFNIAVIVDKNGYESIGTSEGFPIPERYIDEIKNTEFGAFMDKFANTNNIKQNFGGVYVLTRKLTREDLTTHAFTMALTQFVNGENWKN